MAVSFPRNSFSYITKKWIHPLPVVYIKTYSSFFLREAEQIRKTHNSLFLPFHGSDAMNVLFLRTYAFVHSWLADKWAMKKGCNHQFQCMQETWRQDAKNREQMTSLSEHEEIENLKFLRLVHRCNRQKKGSSVRKDKRGYVTLTFLRDRFIHIKNLTNHNSVLW